MSLPATHTSYTPEVENREGSQPEQKKSERLCCQRDRPESTFIPGEVRREKGCSEDRTTHPANQRAAEYSPCYGRVPVTPASTSRGQWMGAEVSGEPSSGELSRANPSLPHAPTLFFFRTFQVSPEKVMQHLQWVYLHGYGELEDSLTDGALKSCSFR